MSLLDRDSRIRGTSESSPSTSWTLEAEAQGMELRSSSALAISVLVRLRFLPNRRVPIPAPQLGHSVAPSGTSASQLEQLAFTGRRLAPSDAQANSSQRPICVNVLLDEQEPALLPAHPVRRVDRLEEPLRA